MGHLPVFYSSPSEGSPNLDLFNLECSFHPYFLRGVYICGSPSLDIHPPHLLIVMCGLPGLRSL